MAFLQDPSSDVRKFVVGFMEDAWYVIIEMYKCVNMIDIMV